MKIKIMSVLVALVLLVSVVPCFADGGDDGGLQITPFADYPLYENDEINARNGEFISQDFVPSKNGEANLYFDGTKDVTVKLQKKSVLGAWSNSDSFKPTSSKKHIEVELKKGTTYRIVITHPTGERITGHVRLRELN